MGAFRYRLSSRSRPITVDGYRERARRSVPDMVWAYLEHGAESEMTMRANRSAFAQYSLRSRVLTGRTPKALEVEVAGRRIGLPVLLAPTGLAGLIHWTGELGAARAAEGCGTLSIVSTASSYSLEEVADGTTGGQFFQLYPCSDGSGLQDRTLALMRRAEQAGYVAIFVTVDVPVMGNREWERLRGMGNPPTLTPARVLDAMRRPRWCYGYLRHRRVSARNLVDGAGNAAAMRSLTAHAQLVNPQLDWDDIAWMRERWKGRFYVKGIMHPDDAGRAVGLGADGVVVSNHGGRQLDHAPSTLDALPAVAREVGNRAEVLLDGGIRRGTDVVKALCLGARAVCIGRPFLYGLATEGPPGVRAVLRILHDEIERTLTLMGVGSLDELGPDWLAPAGQHW